MARILFIGNGFGPFALVLAAGGQGIQMLRHVSQFGESPCKKEVSGKRRKTSFEFKTGFADGYLTDADTWLEALESRNILTHTYEEKAAEQAVKLIRESYYPMVQRLHDGLRKRL